MLIAQTLIDAYEKMSNQSMYKPTMFINPKTLEYVNEYMKLCKVYEGSGFLRAKLLLLKYKHFGVNRYARVMLPD